MVKKKEINAAQFVKIAHRSTPFFLYEVTLDKLSLFSNSVGGGGVRRPSTHEYVNDGVKVYCLPDEQWFASKIYDFGVIFHWGIFMYVFLITFLG